MIVTRRFAMRLLPQRIRVRAASYDAARGVPVALATKEGGWNIDTVCNVVVAVADERVAGIT